MPTTLYELIDQSKKGDEKATLEIIKKFNPILRKYSKKLNYDGSETDLIIALIKTIDYITDISNNDFAKNEGYIVGYINKSMKHEYIRLSRYWYSICKYELDSALINSDKDTFCENYDYIYFYEIINKLPFLQRKVIIEIFINGKSCSEIAKALGISRQAVNNLKNRALKNL